MKTFGLSVGAENAKQIGGIFPTMPLKCAAVLGSPSPFAHCVVFGWCISSGELRAGSQGFPACCVAIISFCLFVCTITELLFKDTSDLWTSYFNRTNRDHVCAFSGASAAPSSPEEPFIPTLIHPAAHVKTHGWEFWTSLLCVHKCVTHVILN